ncbi:MAG: phasin family protein [Gammaproteobacteria bacterium]|nr:phasin family protein [Gammaproteobacteria bacterium]
MATRRNETVPVKKKAASAAPKPPPAKKVVARRPAGQKAAPAAKPKPAEGQTGKPGLLRAGLAALGTVRDDVVKRQTHVIENLLGISPPAVPGDVKDKAKAKPAARGFPGLDSFGIRKFEDVFDQRVATSLQRLGMPTAEEVQALREQMRLLLEHLDRLDSSRRRKR